ncbi:unnamed protein product, partial [Didymodactylos carnosus]
LNDFEIRPGILLKAKLNVPHLPIQSQDSEHGMDSLNDSLHFIENNGSK